MTTWKMPPIPGELTEHHRRSDPDSVGFYIDGEVIWVPVALLTEVKVLPPEPPDDHVVRTPGGHVWQRCDDAAVAATVPTRPWRNEDMGWESWAGVCDFGTPVLLVPAPETMNLPWHGTTLYASQLVVGPGEEDPVGIRVDTSYGSLSPSTARKMAYALLTAADEADRRVSDATP